ncbi:MAG: transcription initiation factor IIB family protein [Promethearchaeota archaeon]
MGLEKVETAYGDYEICCDKPEIRPYRGILVCRNCGTVHGPVLADSPRRAFSEEEITQRRQSEPVYRTIGARTVIPRSNVDITGAPLSAKTKSLFWRLAKIQKSVTSTFERNLSIAQPKLLNIASILGLPQTVTEEALRIYSRAVKNKLTMGRSIDNLVAASIFIAIKLHGIPRTLDEVASSIQISRKSLSKAYRLIMQEFNIKLQPVSPVSFIAKFASELGLNIQVQNRAKELLEITEKKTNLVGKDPKGLASAAIYIAAKELNDSRSQVELSKVAHISEVTLRNRIKNIKKAAGLSK